MLIVGVDENGLGPQLGPLIATAVTVNVKTRRYNAARLYTAATQAGVADSKAVSGFGKMSDAESLSLAMLTEDKKTPADVDALLNRLSLEQVSSLQRSCPSKKVAAQCFGASISLPHYGGTLERGREMLTQMEEAGVSIRRTRSAVHCAKRIQDGLAQGDTKVRMDLGLFEALLLDARTGMGEPLHAICGYVGGIRKYENYLRRIEVHASLDAPDGEVAYESGVGHLRFERKADARHLPVALASMVGKYLRELLMERICRFYQAKNASLRLVSGYHDPNTRAFVSASAGLRKRAHIPDTCFFR